MKLQSKKRCHWCGENPLYVTYHDKEWGVPVYTERKLFEFILLEGMQAGLSWITVLKKRAHMRKVFAHFNPTRLVQMSQGEIASLLQDPGIIRNRLKVNAVFTNARAYLALKERGVNFVDYLWQFTEGRVILNTWKTPAQVPTTTPEAKNLSKALKAEGFKFVGETICYAFMQAVGMVNDHTVDCFRHKELS